MKTSFIYINKVREVRRLWLTTMLAGLVTFQLIPCMASAQTKDSIRTYTEEHPLVYEDAWDLWPYVFLNEEGEPAGYNVDLLKMMLHELKIPYVIKLKPTHVALNDLKAGHADLMCGMDAHFHNDYGKYGKTVIQIFTHSVVHQKDVPAKIKTVNDLAHHRVLVHTGSFSHHLMIQNGWEHNAIPYEDMKDAVQRAHLDPESQIVWNTISLKWLVQTLQLNNLELSPVQMPHGEYKFMSNDPQLLHRLDSVYTILNSARRLQAIQNKWFYPEYKESGIPSWIWQLMIGMLVLFLLALVFFEVYRRQEKKMTREIRRSNNRLALILKTSGVRPWVLHVDSKIVTEYTGSDTEHTEVVGLREFLSILREEDINHVVTALNKIATRQAERLTVDVQTVDEESNYLHNLTIGVAVLRADKDGRPTDIIGTTSDVTDEYLRQLHVKDAMLRYQSIFNSAMIDTVTYDDEGYLVDMNEKASRALPGGKQQALETHINLLDVLGSELTSLDEMQPMHMTRVYTADADQRVFNPELHKDRMYYELQLVPVRNADGKLMTVFGTGRDVTELVHSYQQLQRNARQLEQMNIETSNYIRNIDYVLQNGGVRMVSYSPVNHTLTVFTSTGQQKRIVLTQTRALGLMEANSDSRRVARKLFNSMDNQHQTALTGSVETLLRIHGRKLALYFSFVPTIDTDGNVTEYFGMCRDISEIKAAEQLLAEETAKAQEVETVKSAFLRNMSYEIRTPLNSVVGFAELFAMEHAEEDESFFIKEIKENAAHLLKLINDILFLSRLDAHMIEIKAQPIDFAAFIEPRCQVAWYNHRQEGVDFVVDNPYQRLVIDLDEQNLGLVIDQIVANAAEHTTSGQVRIYYDYTGTELALAFQDTGSGIPPERMKDIFQRFGSSSGKGTGLGLPICYELTAQMGGKIRIKSEVGQGTIVWVTIPCHCSEIVRK